MADATTPPPPERSDQARPEVTIDQELDAKITELYAIRSKMHDEEDAEGGLMPEDQRTLRLADMAIDILERCERERRPEHPDDLKDMRMQRDVFCEKLNEYIDKTKTAEAQVTRLRSLYETTMTIHEEAAKLAHSRGCELEAAWRAAKNTTCPNCGLTLEPRCQNCD